MKTTIPKSEIRFNPSSYVDPNARVFEWQGIIYRAISPEKAELYKSLCESDFFADLQKKKKIVGTQLTDYSLDGFVFVFKHERIPFISYCVEWPALMLKDAALLTLDICQNLAERKLSLQDAYPWNVYFNWTQPVFIDVGSIVDAPEDLLWTPYQQFCEFFLYPLYLTSIGFSQLVRSMLFNYLGGIREEIFIKLIPLSYKLMRPKMFLRVVLPHWLERIFPEAPQKIQKILLPFTKEIAKKTDFAKLRRKFLKALVDEVRSIKIPIVKTNWFKYYGENFSISLLSCSEWDQKQRIVSQILERINPRSVLDIACNRGWFSMLAASKGCEVVAFDNDEHCISQLYLDAKKQNMKILPLVMDVLNPTPAFGWNAHQFPSAIERFRCEIVFAFALVHHLVFKQWQNFDRISETLSAFSKKWVLVEFPLPEDDKVKEMWTDRCNWYNIENFIKSIKVNFDVEEIFDSYPVTRKLILCQKK